MADFKPKPNSGVLWPNDRKTGDNHPDVRGDLFVSVALLKELSPKAEDGLIKLAVSGWKKELGGKRALSLSASAPYVKPASTASIDYDEDTPF
jgi:hypothetical protein